MTMGWRVFFVVGLYRIWTVYEVGLKLGFLLPGTSFPAAPSLSLPPSLTPLSQAYCIWVRFELGIILSDQIIWLGWRGFLTWYRSTDCAGCCEPVTVAWPDTTNLCSAPLPGVLDTSTQSRVRRYVVETWQVALTKHATMFSIFSKSSKTVVDSDKASSVYADTVGSRVSQNDVTHVPRDVRSSVSACKEYKRERKKSRSRNFRGLFSSDCEDEITSVVSDNPQLYHRSCSMVSRKYLHTIAEYYPLERWSCVVK